MKTRRRYFNENPAERRKIFRAVVKFRFIIVGGLKSEWQLEKPAKWRIDNNRETAIEIRSSNVFLRALEELKKRPSEFLSFTENPKTYNTSELETFWSEYGYIDRWRQFIA